MFKLLVSDGLYSLADWIDILLIAAIFYQLALLIKGTRSFRIVLGVAILFFPIFISPWLKLNAINWILTKILPVGIIALVVIFQPELRKMLAALGRGGGLLGREFYLFKEEAIRKTTDEIKKAVEKLAEKRYGALIVLERGARLDEFIATGIRIQSTVVAELLVNIFHPETPLHDGAVIIREDKIEATNCILPLTENSELEKTMGTRHRAGLGITELSDALSIVVSQETGAISFMFNGKMTRNLNLPALARLLSRMYGIKYSK